MEDQQTLTRFITDPALQCTLVAVTNNEQFARKCNHVILLDQGRIIMQGSLDDIKQSEAYQKLFSNLL
jgi:ABC-type bacteriocin/lantibiotic exporter with double-glycine peptidase domain